MSRSFLFGMLAVLVVVSLGATASSRARDTAHSSAADSTSALAGIRALHRADSIATISGDPKALSMLFTANGVRMEPGAAAVKGRDSLLAEDTRFRAAHPGSGITKYVPHFGAPELHGDWAVEWGYFDAAYIASKGEAPQAIRGKLLRVLHRESDGSWRFSHVMWNMAE